MGAALENNDYRQTIEIKAGGAEAAQAVPLACDLTALSDQEREAHGQVYRRLAAAVVATQELPDGYAWRYAAEDYMLVTAFVANERRCCPFFRFVVEVSPGHGPVWLRITGGPEVKAFLEAL